MIFLLEGTLSLKCISENKNSVNIMALKYRGGLFTVLYTSKYDYPFGAGIFCLILAHPVYKMWIIQEPKKVALWNKRHFEEKRMQNVQHV
jgi:hypothetical protein